MRIPILKDEFKPNFCDLLAKEKKVQMTNWIMMLVLEKQREILSIKLDFKLIKIIIQGLVHIGILGAIDKLAKLLKMEFNVEKFLLKTKVNLIKIKYTQQILF